MWQKRAERVVNLSLAWLSGLVTLGQLYVARCRGLVLHHGVMVVCRSIHEVKMVLSASTPRLFALSSSPYSCQLILARNLTLTRKQNRDFCANLADRRLLSVADIGLSAPLTGEASIS